MEVEGSLVITQLDEDDDAKYQCLAKNVVGTRGSAKAQLSILGKRNHDNFFFWIAIRTVEMKLISFLLSYYKKFGMNFYLFLCAFSCLESCCLFNISNFVVARKAQKTLVCHHENYKKYEARC